MPGSLAAAPRPITARPAIRTWTFGASADRTEPAQNTPVPVSMTFLRPSSSPIIPQASMMLAKVSAYAPTTHCRSATPACRLGLDVGERDADHGVVEEGQEQQRAQRRERHPLAAAGHHPLVAGHGPGLAGQPSGPASAGRAARAAGTEPPGISLNRPHRLASPTFQVPSWYTDTPFCPPSKVVLPDTML